MPAPCEALPPELWMLILDHLDDRCFIWFVIRRVSPFLRQIAERVFTTHVLHNIAIRFTGDYACSVVSSSPLLLREPALVEHWQRAIKCPVSPPRASFLFAPAHFAPADSKRYLVFDLQDHSPRRLPDVLPLPCSSGDYVWHCQGCESYRRPAHDVTTIPQPADMFFAQAEDSLAHLLTEPHFVRLYESLRRVVLPSVNLDPEKQQLSLDWRLLLQDFFYDELSMRRVARPWARYLSQPGKGGQTMVHRQGVDVYGLSNFDVRDLDEACQRDGWIFWEMPHIDSGWLTLHQVEQLRTFKLLRAPA